MRILYLGSPAVAVAPLTALVQAGYEIVGVVTQPDRPAGRNRVLTPPPVKVAAQALGLPIIQPPTLRDPAIVAHLSALQPEVGVVAAYGEILRKEILSIPPRGYLNIHPSLLPLYRGPMPVAGAILAGDTETGVTIMKLTPGMDSGPILAQATVPLLADARTGPLTAQLFELGAQLLLEVLPRYAANQLVLREQDHRQATVTRLLTKEDGRIDWTLPAVIIERSIRAYDPWPGAFTTFRGQTLKLLAAQVHAQRVDNDPPGTCVDVADGPLIMTGSGALELIAVQPAGKRRMPGRAWLSGYQQGIIGEQFGA